LALGLPAPPWLAGIGTGTAIAAAGSPAAEVVPPSLPPGGHYASLGESLLIQGRPLSAWVFEVPGSVPMVAAWLSEQRPALRDMWVMPGSAVLGGVDHGRHWAARLFDAGWGRTRGTISVLPLDDMPAVLVPVPGPASMRPWQLQGGQLRFELQSREAGDTVFEQVWTHAASPERLRRTLCRALRAQGWREAPAADASIGDPDQNWSRERQRLSLVIAPIGRGGRGGSGVIAVLRVRG
jgi:hypothetical protein